MVILGKSRSPNTKKKRKEEATPTNCSLTDVLGVAEKNPIVVGGCGLGNASGSSSEKYFL